MFKKSIANVIKIFTTTQHYIIYRGDPDDLTIQNLTAHLDHAMRLYNDATFGDVATLEKYLEDSAAKKFSTFRDRSELLPAGRGNFSDGTSSTRTPGMPISNQSTDSELFFRAVLYK